MNNTIKGLKIVAGFTIGMILAWKVCEVSPWLAIGTGICCIIAACILSAYHR